MKWFWRAIAAGRIAADGVCRLGSALLAIVVVFSIPQY
jgi:hypothetical protein